jgi:DNA-binding transcriptional MerR regulator
MRYIQIFVLASGDYHIAEQSIPFTNEIISSVSSKSCCVGVLDLPEADADWIRENSELHVDANGVTLKFKDPEVQAKLVECTTRHTRLIGGKYAVPEKVKSHLRKQFAHRSDLTMTEFKNLGFSLAEIKALPHFQHQARLAANAKEIKRKEEVVAARLERNLTKRRLRADPTQQ